MPPILPQHIWTQILPYLENLDLKSLRLVSICLEEITTPLLFESVKIRASEHNIPYLGIEKALSSSFQSPRDALQLARRVTFTAHRGDKGSGRCIHFDSEGYHHRQRARRKRYFAGGFANTNEDGDDDENGHEADDEDSVSSSSYPDEDLLEDQEPELAATQKKDVQRLMHWEFDIECPRGVVQLKNRALVVLIRCKEGALTEFNWDLGVCCSDPILGYDGILHRRQKNLETIRIINDNECLGHEYWLHDFPRLKKLTWVALTRLDDFYVLQECIANVGHQLTELELDFYHFENRPRRTSNQGSYSYIPWAFRTAQQAQSGNYFAWVVLGLELGSRRPILKDLRRLSLRGVPFTNAGMELTHAWTWSRLRCLTLRLCPGWDELIDQALLSKQQIRLQSLTLVPSFTAEFLPGHQISTISSFLAAFSGLEELFLATGESAGTLKLWTAVLNHQKTLKRFVHDQRGPEIDRDASYPPIPTELPFSDEELGMLQQSPAANPIASLDLEFLGLNIAPEKMRLLLTPLTHTTSTLKGIHIRSHQHYNSPTSNINLRTTRTLQTTTTFLHQRITIVDRPSSAALTDLETWAFGQTGFSSLELILYGDYSVGIGDANWMGMRGLGAVGMWERFKGVVGVSL